MRQDQMSTRSSTLHRCSPASASYRRQPSYKCFLFFEHWAKARDNPCFHEEQPRNGDDLWPRGFQSLRNAPCILVHGVNATIWHEPSRDVPWIGNARSCLRDALDWSSLAILYFENVPMVNTVTTNVGKLQVISNPYKCKAILLVGVDISILYVY